MSTIKIINLKKVIPTAIFNTCLIDGQSKKDILNEYPKRSDGAYYLDKFNAHLRNAHGISIKEYVKAHLNEKWPHCPTSDEEVGFTLRGVGMIFSEFKKGRITKEHCPAFKEACEKMSKERLGNKNPMYGKKAWNTGLTKEVDERIALIAKKSFGRKGTDSSRRKMREARQRHPLKARHAINHTEESKEKMRKATCERWRNGGFSFKKTNIERKTESWLLENGYNFEFQSLINGFVADFACLMDKIVIECQGDFFHCNPEITKYATPKYAVQKRNVYRDSIKKKVYAENGWRLIELWESDINSGEFENILKCELKK